MLAIVTIKLKDGVLDPQAKAIHNAISSLGFDDVCNVSVKKQILLEFKNITKNQANSKVQSIAQDLLANPVIEDYEIEMRDD